MPILADENVPAPIVKRLRLDGFTIFSIAEAMSGASDEVVLHHANSRKFLLITADRDFGELAIRQKLPVAGIVLLEIERLTLPRQIEIVAQHLANGEEQWFNFFSVIEPGRIRQRALP